MRCFARSLVRVTLVAAVSFAALVPASITLAQDKTTITVLELDGAYPERARMMSPIGKGQTTFREVVDAVKEFGADDTSQALMIKLKEPKLGVTQVQELGRAMEAARAAGKKVFVYAYGYGTPELLLGSYADQVIAQAGGGVSLPGMAISEMYLADTLTWVGVKADMVQVGDYKGAADPLANSRPSEAWSQNIEQLLDSMYGGVREQIKKGRHLDDAKLDKAMDEAWFATAEDAQRLGLIDAALDWPAVGEHLGKVYKTEIAWGGKLLDREGAAGPDMSNPFAALGALTRKQTYAPKRATIAVLHIDGAIIDGDSAGPSLFGSEGSVGSLTIRRALQTIEKNSNIKGLIVRIDSPGGSAIASEVIWQGLKRVSAAGKPVWVSVGSMAASGGYYIAVGGDKIYVNPGSIVGSIGVVGGKLALNGLLSTLKVNVVERTRGPRAAMAGMGAWNDEQRAYVRRKMSETYDLFTGRVSAGRSGIDLSKTAEGRLFTGDKAIALKMADKIGGLDDAITDLAAELGLADGQFDVMDYPAPSTFMEMIEKMLGQTGMTASSPVRPSGSILATEAAAIGRELLGEQGWASLRDSMQGLLQLRKEPVLLMSPRAIIVR